MFPGHLLEYLYANATFEIAIDSSLLESTKLSLQITKFDGEKYNQLYRCQESGLNKFNLKIYGRQAMMSMPAVSNEFTWPDHVVFEILNHQVIAHLPYSLRISQL